MARGEETRERILEHAYRVATRDGLGGLTIGTLSSELGMSKSGLFAHFGSKEDLQIAVLTSAADHFSAEVVAPAFKATRGEPRIKKLFENWLRWSNSSDRPGGCIFMAASTELDDQEGRPRDYLAGIQKQWLDTIAKAARLSIDAGHFRPDLDCDQFAFDFQGILMASQHGRRLLRDPKSDARSKAAFERLLADARTPKH